MKQALPDVPQDRRQVVLGAPVSGTGRLSVQCTTLYVLLQAKIVALSLEALRLLLLQAACIPVGGAAGCGGLGARATLASLLFVELLLVAALSVHLLPCLGLAFGRLLFLALQEALSGRLDSLMPVPLLEFQNLVGVCGGVGVGWCGSRPAYGYSQ